MKHRNYRNNRREPTGGRATCRPTLTDEHVRWVASGAGLAGVLVVLLATSKYGVGLSPDSANYLASSRNLLSGGGLVCADGTQMVSWPPLFPVILSLLGRLGVEPWDGARFVNAFAFGLTVYMSGLLFRKVLVSRMLVLAAIAAVLLSPALVSVSVMAWTELLFALLLVLYLGRLYAFISGGRTSTFALLCLVTVLAGFQRYMGASLILSGALAMLIVMSRVSAKRRAVYALVYGLVCGVPILLWLARNYRLTNTFTGSRPSALTAVWPAVSGVFAEVAGWLAPHAPRVHAAWVAPVAGAVLCVGCGYLVRRASTSTDKTRSGMLHVAVLVAAVYIAAVLAVVSRDAVSQLPRFIAPLFPLAVMLAMEAAEYLARRLAAHLRRGLLADRALLFLYAGWLAYAAFQTIVLTRDWTRDGAGGYNTRAWRESETVRWLRDHPPPGDVISNGPDALRVLAGTNARMTPRFESTSGQPLPPHVPTPVYLVWFHRIGRPYLYRPDELAQHYGLVLVQGLTDGDVFYVVKPESEW